MSTLRTCTTGYSMLKSTEGANASTVGLLIPHNCIQNVTKLTKVKLSSSCRMAPVSVVLYCYNNIINALKVQCVKSSRILL